MWCDLYHSVYGSDHLSDIICAMLVSQASFSTWKLCSCVNTERDLVLWK